RRNPGPRVAPGGMPVATIAHDVFSLPLPVLEKMLRAVVVYVFLVVVLRVVGKRELGQQNTLDLVVLLLIANAVQNAIIGVDNSFSGSVISVLTLVALNETINRVAFFSPALSWLFGGSEGYLIRDGMPVTRPLFRSGISLPDLPAIARPPRQPHLPPLPPPTHHPHRLISIFNT